VLICSAIAGIVVGIVVVLIGVSVIILIVILKRKRKQKQKIKTPTNQLSNVEILQELPSIVVSFIFQFSIEFHIFFVHEAN
jgi:flagellar basal body-associated protein FliL